ncbi:MAG: transglycosylase domain-containing protein, partial [Eubacteriaceae bacterium]|nr:transglycosylase domain-containing protein [Eubacteriaceae bacterium]
MSDEKKTTGSNNTDMQEDMTNETTQSSVEDTGTEAGKKEGLSKKETDKSNQEPRQFSFGGFKGFGKKKEEPSTPQNISEDEPAVGSSIESLSSDVASTAPKAATGAGVEKAVESGLNKKSEADADAVSGDQTGASPKKKFSFRNLNKGHADTDVKTPEDADQPVDDTIKKDAEEAGIAAAAAGVTNKVKGLRMGRKKASEKNKDKGLPKKSGGSGGLPKKERKKLKTWQKVLIILGLLIIAGVVAVFAIYQANRVDISDYQYTQKQKTQIISADNVVIGELFSQNRTYVSLDQVPQDMKNALVAVEDSRFYSHGGVDFFGIARSLVANVVRGSATSQGASTLTQQLAR